MSQNEQIMFKRGIAVYPAVTHADTRFNEHGDYKANLKFKEEAAQDYIKQLSKIYKDHVGKPHPKRPTDGKSGPLFYFELDDEGDETGYVIFKIQKKNKPNKKTGKVYDKAPKVIDGKKNVVGDDVMPWGGSIFTVKAEVYKWEWNGSKGVNLQPLIVQINELVQGSGGPDLNTDDFDEDEDGFVSDTSDFEDENDGSHVEDDEDY